MTARTFLVLVLASCSGGPAGGIITVGSNPDQAPTKSGTDRANHSATDRANHSATDEPTKSGTDVTGGTTPNTGGTGGPACFPCDRTYSCTGAIGDASVVAATFEAKSQNGVCVVEGSQLTCDGKVVDPGTNRQIGTWASGPNGILVTTSDGSLTCNVAVPHP